jgi:hypothetical protein
VSAAPYAKDYAGVIAQVVPALLIGALLLPLRGADGTQGRKAAAGDLLLTGFLLGAAFVTEFAALYGLLHDLSRQDVRLLNGLLLGTALLAFARILAPLARAYATKGGIPEPRVWRFVLAAFIGGYLGLLYLANWLV